MPLQIELTEYRLRFTRPLSPPEAARLRGFFGNTYADEVLLHHHQSDGQLLYEYPRVQFKVLARMAHLIGLAKGGAIVERLWREVDQARIGEEQLPVLEASLVRRRERLGEADALMAYRFRSPWLGLNQANHRRYESCTTDAERQELLARLLIGNCLALAKAFGHRVEARLTAEVGKLYPTPTRLKGVPMLGFRGVFRVNFHLPAQIGIGKSVSRGFGTVEPLWQDGQS
jgi:hypothetical protein